MILMHLISVMNLKDAFRVSLNTIVPLFTAIEFISGLISANQWKDNALIVFILICILIEGILLIVTNHLSKSYE